MDLIKEIAPLRTVLYWTESFSLTPDQLIKIMTPGNTPVIRLQEGPEAGKKWDIVVSIRGEETDA